MTRGLAGASLTPFPCLSYHLQSLGSVGKTFPERVVMRVPSRSKPATWRHQEKNSSDTSNPLTQAGTCQPCDHSPLQMGM